MDSSSARCVNRKYPHTFDSTQLISPMLYLFTGLPEHSYGWFRYRTRPYTVQAVKPNNRWPSAAMLLHVSCGMLELLINTFVCGLYFHYSAGWPDHTNIYTIQFTLYHILNNMWVHTGRFERPEVEPRWGRYFSRGAQPAHYTMGTGSFPGVKRPGRGIYHPSYLAPKLKKKYRNISTPPLGLSGLF